MKYKYTRKEIADKWETTIKYSGNDLIRDLLSQKEDRKEWEPCDCPKGGGWEYEDGNFETCKKCGGVEWVKVKRPTPSLLEIEEIEEIDWAGYDDGGNATIEMILDLSKVINKLIKNDRILVEIIKSLTKRNIK